MSRQYPRTKYVPSSYHSKSLLPTREEDMSEYRIITKNLVYVIGLSASLASREKLMTYEYFGQYGTIQKIVVNQSKAYNQGSPYGPSFSAYITYSKPSEASIAILSLDDTIIDNHCIRASFGTSKYCAFFIKGVECNNKDCVYLHKIADEADIIHRKDLSNGKYIFNKQHEYAIKIADIYNPVVKRKLMNIKRVKTVFPAPNMIYRSVIVIQNDPENKKHSYERSTASRAPIESSKSGNSSNKTSNETNSAPNKKYISPSLEFTHKKTIPPQQNNKTNTNPPQTTEDKTVQNINSDLSNLMKEKDKLFGSAGTISTTCSISKEDFSNKFCSRFDFVNINSEENYEEVPNQIKNYIDQKLNLYSLNRYMNNKIVDKYLKEEYLKNKKENTKSISINDWTCYNIQDKPVNKKPKKDNSNTIEYDEFIQDFDNINTFIIQSCEHDLNENKIKTTSKL